MKRPPRQVRLDEDTESEVKKIAEVTSLPQIEIIRQTIKAGVGAIKENNYELPLPLRLKVVTREPSKASSSSRYPLHQPNLNEAHETLTVPLPPGKKKRAA